MSSRGVSPPPRGVSRALADDRTSRVAPVVSPGGRPAPRRLTGGTSHRPRVRTTRQRSRQAGGVGSGVDCLPRSTRRSRQLRRADTPRRPEGTATVPDRAVRRRERPPRPRVHGRRSYCGNDPPATRSAISSASSSGTRRLNAGPPSSVSVSSVVSPAWGEENGPPRRLAALGEVGGVGERLLPCGPGRRVDACGVAA